MGKQFSRDGSTNCQNAAFKKGQVPFSPAAAPVRRRSHGKSKMLVDYTLNKTKAAKKKAIVTLNDQSVSIECKHDNLVLDFSAGAYELFKSELLNYYEHSVDRKCTLEHQKKTRVTLLLNILIQLGLF